MLLTLAPALLADPVRKVDFSQVLDMKDLATHARQLGNEVYPKILALLGDDPSKAPEHFDIKFKQRLKTQEPGRMASGTGGMAYRLPFSGGTILLNSEWLAQHPGDLDMFLVHEMAHTVQDYKARRWFKTPYSWREGIPDYVCYKLGYTNDSRCPECSLSYPHYTSGYTCAGAFLFYIDAEYGSNVIAQLNREIRLGSYSDKFFFKATGKTLDELWVAFKNTSAFTPVAGELNTFHEALGYVKGKPPRNVQARLESYLKQHYRTNLAEIHRFLGYVKGKPPEDVLDRFELGLYLRQPAGKLSREAGEFMLELQKKGQLPGLLDGEAMSFRVPDGGYSEVYPFVRTFHRQKKDDASLYNYTIVRTSKESPWELQRAWKTGKGRILEEYPIQIH